MQERIKELENEYAEIKQKYFEEEKKMNLLKNQEKEQKQRLANI